MRIGVRGNDMAAEEIPDRFGTRSGLTFTPRQLNGPVAAEAFTFKAPLGADVVRQ